MITSILFGVVSFFIAETTFNGIGKTLGEMFDKPIVFLYCICFLYFIFEGIGKWRNKRVAGVLLASLVSFITLANYLTMRFNNKFFAFSDIGHFANKLEVLTMFIGKLYSPLLIVVILSSTIFVVLSLIYKENISIYSVDRLVDYNDKYYSILYDEKKSYFENEGINKILCKEIELEYNSEIDVLESIKSKFMTLYKKLDTLIMKGETKKTLFSSNRWGICIAIFSIILSQFIYNADSFYFSNLMNSYKSIVISVSENAIYEAFGVPKEYYNENLLDVAYEEFDRDVDVVVIQSEAFFDFAKIDDLVFSKDITENFRAYQQEGMWGKSFVPVIGGLTCNSEFEFLTAMKVGDLYGYQIPFEEIPLQKTNSLAWDFKNYGFKTKAVHGYRRDFFRRDKVYPMLGIDEFIAEDDFEDAFYYGAWMSDKDLFNRILEELEEEEGNQFIYTVTVQNHGPFSYKAPKDLVSVKNLTKEDKASLENYAAGLKISDNQLKVFMEALRERDKETIVVFYGDHIFSAEHEIISQNEYFTSNTNNLYATDYFMWSSKGSIEPNHEDISLLALSRQLKKQILPSTYFDEFVLDYYSNESQYFGEVNYENKEAYSTVINGAFANTGENNNDAIYMEIKN